MCPPSPDRVQGENRHHGIKLNAQTRSNNKETEQQLGEMDYINFNLRRIADDLRRADVSIPDDSPAPTSVADEVRPETEFTIAKGRGSTIYIPHWLRDHRDDPALMASLTVRVLPKILTVSWNRASRTSCAPTSMTGF